MESATASRAGTEGTSHDGAAADGASFEVLRPTDGSVIQTVPIDPPERVGEVTDRVRAAQPEWEATQLEHAARDLVARLGLKPGQLFSSLRVAVTGRTVSPPLFDTMETLGRSTTLTRLGEAITRLSALPDEAPRQNVEEFGV